jgi:hypothetical protein
MPNKPDDAPTTGKTKLQVIAGGLDPSAPPRRRRSRVDRLVDEAMAIGDEDARSAGAVGYMAKVLVQATLPHRNVEGTHFERANGNFRLTITATDPRTGLPYGSYPRLLLAWMTTEAVRTKSREIELGPTLSAFMQELALLPTGGRWGTIPRLKDQMLRLFGAAISCHYKDAVEDRRSAMLVTDGHRLWWNPKAASQASLWKSTVTLSERFFGDIVESPIPVDMRALRALKQSPMALDIYSWLAHRMSYLRQKTVIPWAALQFQIGCDYSRTRDFRLNFEQQLRAVRLVYPAAKVEGSPEGLVLRPSFTHIPRAR